MTGATVSGPTAGATPGGPTERADLLALDADALAALANRGLVKRAAREVESNPPVLTLSENGTVEAGFADGVRTELPIGGLDQGTCTCGAPGICRHVIGLVLAYRDGGPQPETAKTEHPDWSPGEFGDAELTARLGARLMTTARRAERSGYVARVRRGTVPVVELGSATVRFLVPHDLGFVHTDVAGDGRDEAVALAVWAFRVADARFPGRDDCRVEVGGTAPGSGGSGLEAVVELAGAVLLGGAAHGGPGLAAAVAVQIRQVERDGLQWPLRALDELGAQLTAYRDRSARYAPEALAGLIAELFARHRAIVAGGSSLRSRVLGTEEPAETPLRRVRLDGLGARVSAAGDERRVEVFHAHATTGVVLVSRRDWTTGDDGPALGRRRVAGSTVGGLAAGTVITESAVRTASRAVRLATNRVAQTTVTPSAGAWDDLPAGLLVRDFGDLGAELAALPPRPVRARVEAELVRVLSVAEVAGMRYEAGRQRLTVQIVDATGAVATVAVTHAAAAPGRLDAVAAAFSGARGRPRFVAGTVHRGGGGVVLEPSAIAADGVPIVPDLAAPDPEAMPGVPAEPSSAAPPAEPPAHGPPDPLRDAIARAAAALTDAAHIGLSPLPSGYADRLTTAAANLTAAGMWRAAQSLRRLTTPLPAEQAIEAWLDAYLRLTTAADLL